MAENEDDRSKSKKPSTFRLFRWPSQFDYAAHHGENASKADLNDYDNNSHPSKGAMVLEERNVDSIKKQILATAKNPEDIRHLVDQLVDETKRVILVPPANPKRSNPAIIGLASFAITATLFQFHNFGWVKLPAVLFLGIVLGGLVQLFAGLLEFITGNGFGFAIFTTFGAFWITLALILLGQIYTKDLVANEADLGWFMLVFLIFTGILLACSIKHNTILPLLILTLFLGILFLMVGHFLRPEYGWYGCRLTGAIILLINSIMAYYFLAALLLEDSFHRKILPVGVPVIDFFKPKRSVNVRRDQSGTVVA